MFKQCLNCNNSYEISDEELLFIEKVSPKIGNEIYTFPPPNYCPNCRLQKRMIWRNERNLFKRKCSKTKELIISSYPENTTFPVYKNNYWWSDENDAIDFGKSLSFEKSIFQQMRELRAVVPRLANFNFSEDRMINSLYTNCAGDLKNCYFTFGAGRNENCLYCNYVNDCRECVDCFFSFQSEGCYECIDIDICNFLFYSSSCKQCFDSYYLFDCISCNNCIGCIGLRQKKFYVLNKAVSKEEFIKIKEMLLCGSKEEKNSFIEKYNKLKLNFPKKEYHGDNNQNCLGDYIWNSKNCFYCFDTKNAEDCKYCVWFADGRSCMDFFAWGEAELCYQISGGGDNMYSCAFTAQSFGCKNSYYLDLCGYCKNCFACVGLKNKEYCILNKQYNKDEYEALLPEMIDLMKKNNEWGEYFPNIDSPWGYNHTVAADYFPLSRENAKNEGFLWNNLESIKPIAKNPIVTSCLPNDIRLINDDILQQTLICSESSKPFKLSKIELDFYRKNSLPVPLLHPEIRFKNRFNLRNKRILIKRLCDNCSEDLYSSYEKNHKVYCTKCYLEAIY